MHSCVGLESASRGPSCAARSRDGTCSITPAVELCNSALKSSGTCIAGHQYQIRCCGRVSAADHRHFMHPARCTTEQSQQIFVCTTGVNQRRPPRFSSRHNFCGHTSEFPASTFATADQLQHALVPVSAGASCRACRLQSLCSYPQHPSRSTLDRGPPTHCLDSVRP